MKPDFQYTLYIKVNHPTYCRTPLKPAVILIHSTADGSTLKLLYLQRRYEIGRNEQINTA